MSKTSKIPHSIVKSIYLSFLLVLKLSLAFGQSDWKLNTEKDGIKVYTSIVPDSKIKAVKVECNLNATASQLVALLMDVNTSPDWEYHTKSCVMLKQVSSTELYYYSEINLPWPVQNRDFVAHLSITQNPDTKVVFVDFFAKFGKPLAIKATVKAPLISIVAEGDLVVFSFKDEHEDPKARGKKYITTWFDMLRIENGKIAEHWDNALKN